MKGLGASSRIFELLDARPLTVQLGVGRPLPITTPPRRIIFDDVHFAYPSRPGSEVLRGVNLSIEPGTIISIAGGSGSGKSTIANLLERYYDPTQGRVLYGDDNIAEYTPESWRQRIAIVPQDPALFSATIAENSQSGRCSPDTRIGTGSDCLRCLQSPTVDRTRPEPKSKRWPDSPTAGLSRPSRAVLKRRSALGERNSREDSDRGWRSRGLCCRSPRSSFAMSEFSLFSSFPLLAATIRSRYAC